MSSASVPRPTSSSGGHQVLLVACQGCGAGLKVGEGVRYVTCRYCSATLEVLHDETVTHTRVLERLERRTEKVEQEVRYVRLQNELLMLSQGWESYRERMLIRGKNGSVSEPSLAGAVVGGVLWLVVGLFVLVGVSQTIGVFGWVFGLGLLGLGLRQLLVGTARAREFEGMRAKYESRRGDLEMKLREMGRGR